MLLPFRGGVGILRQNPRTPEAMGAALARYGATSYAYRLYVWWGCNRVHLFRFALWKPQRIYPEPLYGS